MQHNAGQFDGALSYNAECAEFLDVPAIRHAFDGAQSSKATEQLFAALDAWLKSSA